MKKVGIVSCYFKNNYGSMLQAYATKKILDNNEIPNETINIDSNVDFKKGKTKYYKSQIFNFKFIKAKFGMIKLKVDKKINKELGKNIAIRTDKYKEFKKEFNLSMACTNYKDLAEMTQISGIQKAFIQLHLSVMLAGFTGLFGKLITLNEVDIVWYRMLFTSIILLVFTGLPQIERKKLLQLGSCGAFIGCCSMAVLRRRMYPSVLSAIHL